MKESQDLLRCVTIMNLAEERDTDQRKVYPKRKQVAVISELLRLPQKSLTLLLPMWVRQKRKVKAVRKGSKQIKKIQTQRKNLLSCHWAIYRCLLTKRYSATILIKKVLQPMLALGTRRAEVLDLSLWLISQSEKRSKNTSSKMITSPIVRVRLNFHYRGDIWIWIFLNWSTN